MMRYSCCWQLYNWIDNGHAKRRKVPPILSQQDQAIRASCRGDGYVGEARMPTDCQRTVGQNTGFPTNPTVKRQNSLWRGHQ